LSSRRGEFAKQIAQYAAKRVEPADFPVAPMDVRKVNGSAGCQQHFT
jgi:hypothetical protein